MRVVKSMEYAGSEFLLHFSDGGSKSLLSLPEALMFAGDDDRRPLTGRILEILRGLGRTRRPMTDAILALLMMGRLGEEPRPCHFLHVGDAPDEALETCWRRLSQVFREGGTFRFATGEPEVPLPWQFFDGVFLDHTGESISSGIVSRCVTGLREGGFLFCLVPREDMIRWMEIADPQGEAFAITGEGYLFFRRKKRVECMEEQMGEAGR